LNCFHIQKLDYPLLNVCLMRGFRFFDKCKKSGRVVHSDVGEHFPVQIDPGSFEAINKLAVGDLRSSASSVDTYYPKRAEIALFQAAADVSVAQCFLDRFLGGAIQLRLGKKKSLRSA